MVYDESRPRRAWLDDDSVDPADDTAAPQPASPRRGGESADEVDLTTTDSDTPLNPFARPGSDEAAQPPPVPDLTDEADVSVEPAPDTPIPAPIFPRSAGEYADSPSPAPRRSALSSTTPVEAEAIAPAPAPAPQQADWVSGNRKTLALWGTLGIVGLLIVGLISFVVSRNAAEPIEGPSSSPASTASSPSASPTPTREPAEPGDLLTAEDLTSIAPAAKWAVTESTFGITEHTGRAACLSTDSQEANPTHSMQRLLATSDDDRLAALHRIDVYATPIAATNVMADLTTRLSTCSELPARIVRSSSVTGMADEAFQLTVVFEDATPQYHTVLLTRAGAAVQLIDVVRNGEPVAPDALTQAIARPQAILCTEQEVTCGTPAVADALIPPGQPQGWLIPADLPRITAGAGRWTMSDPAGVTSRGMGCENMNLTSEPGPTARQQATYLITEDPKAPGAFGMDEMIFTFADNAAADAFTDKLTSAIASCKDRVNTASVQELAPVTSTGANDVGISSRIFNVSQATGDKPVPFQLIVSKAGNRVVYTLTTVSADYKFTDAQLAELGIRIPLRASQA